MRRYQVGCAGQFVLGTTSSTNDLDEAIASCDEPPGCEVFDRVERRWIGPMDPSEIDEAKARLAERRAA